VPKWCEGWSLEIDGLTSSSSFAFSVSDTGIAENTGLFLRLFQQVDALAATCSTGLGLSISREIYTVRAEKLNWTSRPGEGSVFTLYLPQTYQESRKK